MQNGTPERCLRCSLWEGQNEHLNLQANWSSTTLEMSGSVCRSENNHGESSRVPDTSSRINFNCSTMNAISCWHQQARSFRLKACNRCHRILSFVFVFKNKIRSLLYTIYKSRYAKLNTWTSGTGDQFRSISFHKALQQLVINISF